MQIQTAWVTIAASDFEGLIEFYRQILRSNPIALIPNVYAEFQVAELRLGIYQPRGSEAAVDSRFPRISLCLQVESLESAIEHLIKIGYLHSGDIITASHGRELYVYDPDGNRIILYQPHRT